MRVFCPGGRWRFGALAAALAVAGCFAEAGPDAAAPPPLRQRFYQLERSLEWRIDPAAGTVNGEAPREVLAERLNVAIEPAGLVQADGRTRVVAIVRNPGGSLSALKLTISAERPLVDATSPLSLGLLPQDGETLAPLAFDNPTGASFTVTLRLTGTLTAGDAAGAPTAAPEAPAVVAAPSAVPTPTATPSPTPTPSPAPTPTPSPEPTATPSPAPTPTPTPTPVASAEADTTPDPGPGAAAGRVLLNGKPAAGLSLSLVRVNGGSQTLTTDATGGFASAGLDPGDYYAYFYNETDRNKVGYWRSVSQKVDATRGAAFPAIDLYGVGQQNLPLPDGSRETLPVTFEWLPQAQRVESYRLRVHSEPGRTFTLVYQSDRLPGDATTFTWAGLDTLEANHRYFWGLEWDAGARGKGGNLYQGIYFQR